MLESHEQRKEDSDEGQAVQSGEDHPDFNCEGTSLVMTRFVARAEWRSLGSGVTIKGEIGPLCLKPEFFSHFFNVQCLAFIAILDSGFYGLGHITTVRLKSQKKRV